MQSKAGAKGSSCGDTSVMLGLHCAISWRASSYALRVIFNFAVCFEVSFRKICHIHLFVRPIE